MPTDVVMPQMGESVVEGTITKWLKKAGDTVQRDEPLFEISTDKVDAEIPSPASGVLKEVKVKEGATVQVNTVVGVIDADGAGASAASPAKTAPPPAPSAPPPVGAPAAAAPVPTPAPAAAAPAASGPGTEVTMPQMGESIVEGTITKWLKQLGDQIRRDEPLFEISTDKVDAEIPAPAAGVLSEIRVAAGQTVGVNTVVAVIGGTVGPAAATTAAPSPAPQAPVAAPVAPAPSAPAPAAEEEEETVVEGRRIRSSPLVRKIAKENNVNLAQMKGTGLSGRITKEDILNFIQSGGAKAPAPAPAAVAPIPAAKPAAPAPSPAAASPLVGQVVPMTPMRKIIAQRMVESKHTSAHVHSVYEVDMTHVMNLRAKLKNKFEQTTGSKLTPTTFFVRAAVKALREFPIVNASVEGDNINYHREINIGIAVALDWGLIVPVIKHAEEKSFLGLQRAISDLGDRARAKKLLPDDVQGGTFTITNPGQFGQMFGLPIILQPQVAIMGIGSIKKMPVVVTDASGGDSIAIRSICHISLGYDHRVIDGAVADQFLRSVAQHLENWNEELM
jgi:pyruvate dehydrogenase E2 component (dihydrolipoamide acetyltransferase)